MSALRKVGKKRAAAIAAGTYVPKPRKPLTRNQKQAAHYHPKPKGKHDESDSLWRLTVKNRAGGHCQWCGRQGEEAHHLFEKGSARFAKFRHDERNGCYLCKSCHRLGPHSAHSDLPAFRQLAVLEFSWFAELVGVVGFDGHGAYDRAAGTEGVA